MVVPSWLACRKEMRWCRSMGSHVLISRSRKPLSSLTHRSTACSCWLKGTTVNICAPWWFQDVWEVRGHFSMLYLEKTFCMACQGKGFICRKCTVKDTLSLFISKKGHFVTFLSTGKAPPPQRAFCLLGIPEGILSVVSTFKAT